MQQILRLLQIAFERRHLVFASFELVYLRKYISLDPVQVFKVLKSHDLLDCKHTSAFDGHIIYLMFLGKLLCRLSRLLDSLHTKFKLGKFDLVVVYILLYVGGSHAVDFLRSDDFCTAQLMQFFYQSIPLCYVAHQEQLLHTT